MKKFFFALILCFSVNLAFGAAVIQNPYVTNSTANADAHVFRIGVLTGATLKVDPSGQDTNVRNTNATYLTFRCAATNALPGDTIVINPGSYSDSNPLTINLTNNTSVISYGTTTFSNNSSGIITDVALNHNCSIIGGTWNHISTTPGGVNGVIGLAVSSGGRYFTNCELRNVTINSDAGCFKYSTDSASNADCHFYNCRFNGSYAGFTCEGAAATLYNYIYDCEVILTNQISPVTPRAGFKIRGTISGVYYIQNCRVLISDVGITNFAMGIGTGHVPSGAGGSIAAGTFIATGLTIDTTSCTNPLSKDFNVHALAGAIVLNASCWRPDGSELTYSNYNVGVDPFLNYTIVVPGITFPGTGGGSSTNDWTWVNQLWTNNVAWTNTTGKTVGISASANFTLSPQSGVTGQAMMMEATSGSDASTNFVGSTINVLGTIAETHTNAFPFIDVLPGQTVLFSNVSSGSGNTASIVSAGKYVYLTGSGGVNSNGSGLTNTIPWTLLTSTNTPMVFNGTIQSFTVTNVALVLTNLTGANGSLSFRIRPVDPIPITLPTVKWLAGSNSVMTNGILSLTSYGGTNDIVAAMKEGQ